MLCLLLDTTNNYAGPIMSIEFRIDNGIGELTFDDGKANAMDMQWWQLAISLINKARASKPKALIIRGRENIFCAGVNLKMISSLNSAGITDAMNLFNEFINAIRTFPCPTIAEVTGSTIAGGCIVMCSCDYIVALDGDYKIHLNEHNNGLPLPAWCVEVCATRFSPPHIDSFALLAQPFSPQMARDIGAVNELASDVKALGDKAYEAAQRFSKLNTSAFALTKSRVKNIIEPYGQ